MRLQETLPQETLKSLDQLRKSLRTSKAKELFSKLRSRIKRDNLLVIIHRGRIKKMFYNGLWHRPVIINDRLYLLNRGDSIEYLK